MDLNQAAPPRPDTRGRAGAKKPGLLTCWSAWFMNEGLRLKNPVSIFWKSMVIISSEGNTAFAATP